MRVCNCNWFPTERANGLFFEPGEDAVVMEDVVFVTMELSYLFGEAVLEIFDADGALFGQTTVHFLEHVKRQLL
jgi:hypothetical protein